jgi:hypothetical protein
MRPIYKLKGIEYYILNAQSIEEAVGTAILNHWGVTENNIEEVDSISENPVRIIKAKWSFEENQRMTWFRAKFNSGLRESTFYVHSFWGSATDALNECLGSWNKNWLIEIKQLVTDGRHPGKWIEPLLSPLKPSKTKKLTDIIFGENGNN